MSDLQYTETLNDLLAKKASEWTGPDLETIVTSLRAQREKWNAEQAIGSRKLVKSSSVETGRQIPAGSMKQVIKGLKL